MSEKVTKQQAKQLLEKLEQTMREADLWSQQTPSLEALASQAPFACDSMPLEQWLQFIFIPRMYSMIANSEPLPVGYSISPMLEQVMGITAQTRHVHQVLVELETSFDAHQVTA